MVKVVLYLILTIFVFSVVKAVFSIVLRGFGEALRAAGPQRENPLPEALGVTGELKKDPVCGTFTAAETSLRLEAKGQTFYFCSANCRDKFVAKA